MLQARQIPQNLQNLLANQEKVQETKELIYGYICSGNDDSILTNLCW